MMLEQYGGNTQARIPSWFQEALPTGIGRLSRSLADISNFFQAALQLRTGSNSVPSGQLFARLELAWPAHELPSPTSRAAPTSLRRAPWQESRPSWTSPR